MKPTFCDDPDVPFGLCGPPAHVPEPHEPPDSPGLPKRFPAAPSPAGGTERVGTGNTSRERLHPRRTPPEPQLTQIPMSDCDDDQSPQRSREEIHPHVQVPPEPQIQPYDDM